MKWKNRIVGHDEVDPSTLKAHPLNWRLHPTSQEKALEQVLDEVGVVDDIIVNRITGLILDGHLRVEIAKKRKEKTVPVKYVELQEKEEALVLATFDPLGAMADQDKKKLDSILADIREGHEELFDSMDLALKRNPVSFDDAISFDGEGKKSTITITVSECEIDEIKEELKNIIAQYETANVHF